MTKLYKLALAFTLLLLTGCATTWWGAEAKLPKPMKGYSPYRFSYVDNMNSNRRLFPETKFYWKAEPTWGPIEKIKRKVGPGVDINDIAQHPFEWRRRTTNDPVVLIKSRKGFMNILITTIRYGRECVMNRYFLEQRTFQDATANPEILTGSKQVDAIAIRVGSGGGFIDDIRVECDDYDSIEAIKL